MSGVGVKYLGGIPRFKNINLKQKILRRTLVMSNFGSI